MSETLPFSRPVDVVGIGPGGVVERIEANEAERIALAHLLDLVALRSLSAEVFLSQIGRKGIGVEGRVQADIVQTCVVSLVELEQRVDEPFSLRFIRGEREAEPQPGQEIRIDPEEEDPPDIITGPTLDLGAIVVEQLTLVIDPYPRAAGAVLPDNPAGGEDDSRESPFAALAKMTERRSQDD